MGKKYKLLTWGCQMNSHDSEVISGILEKEGYLPVSDLKQADIIILNTCCVRENAERKVYGRIAQLKHLKQLKPNLIIGVTGCMIQQPHVIEYISKKLPYVDILFGIHEVKNLPQNIQYALQTSSPVVDIDDPSQQNFKEGLPIKRHDNINAWVTITYGCNNFCSYCIVPYVRGREKSRRPEDILDEVKKLAQQGYKEVTLLGQNVNSYGKDLINGTTFPELLRKINDVDGIKRIRFLTSHPKDLSDDLIVVMRDCKNVCEHIHLPVQAGSDKVLKNMNRKYTREEYIELVHKLRDSIPDISITTDIIVGFPGETEQDFSYTLDLIKTVNFDSAFTFIFSPRKGTPAERMKNQINEKIKKERLNQLMELQNAITAEKNKKLEGKTVEVLVEGRSKNNPHRLTGRTRSMKLVNFSGPEEFIGKLVNVTIVQPHTWSLLGKLES